MNINDNLQFLRKINSIESNILDIKNKVDKIFTLTILQNVNNKQNTPCDLISRLSKKKNKTSVHKQCSEKPYCAQIQKYPYCKAKK